MEATLVHDRIEMINFISEAVKSEKAIEVLHDALDTEALRLTYSLNLAKKRLKKFEKKYSISSEKFIREWYAEDLKGKDMEYVEWSGEYHFFKSLDERLKIVKGIRYGGL